MKKLLAGLLAATCVLSAAPAFAVCTGTTVANTSGTTQNTMTELLGEICLRLTTPAAPGGLALDSSVDGLESTASAISAKLPATLGIKTAANSLSFAPASDATFVPSDGVTPSGSPLAITNSSPSAEIDVRGYGAVEIYITGTFSASLTAQFSDTSGGTFVTANMLSEAGTSGIPTYGAQTGFSSTNARYIIPVAAPYFRIGVTSYGSGTASIAVRLLKDSPIRPVVIGNTVANGMNSSGAGVPPAGIAAQCDDTSPVAVTENSWANLRLGCADHSLLVRPFSTPSATWSYTAGVAGLTTVSDTAVHASCGAGLKNYVISAQAYNASANAHTVALKDGSTVIWATQLAAAIGDGKSLVTEAPLAGSAATALNVAVGTTDATLINVQGYCAP